MGWGDWLPEVFIMTFKDQLRRDALNTFLNNNEFAEDITYTPLGGTAKAMKAVITRSRPIPLAEEASRTLAKQAEIEIPNDATYGVTSVNKGGDTVSLPAEVNGSPVNMRVVDILNCDEGMWHLLCQA